MKAKTLAFAGAVLATMSYAAAVEAADYHSAPTSPSYAPVESWAGFYLGSAVGYADVRANLSLSIPGLGTITDSETEGSFVAGPIWGYNWQSGSQVFGIEADVNFPGDFDYLASVRGRYGLLSGNWLFYGTAGVGLIGSGAETVGSYHWDGFNSAGFVAGLGAEIKINSYITAGLEGLYYVFPEDTQDIGGGVIFKVDPDILSIRARATYKFD
jgi:outer membrane immunogenic protein